MTRGWDLTPARNLGARPELFERLRADARGEGPTGVLLRRARPRKRGVLTPADEAAGAQQIFTPPGQGLKGATWPFRVGVSGANLRTCAVSPQFSGPCLLDLIFSVVGSAAVTGANFALFWATDGEGQGQNLAETFRPSGTPVFEPITFITPQNTDPDTQREHYDHTAAGIATADFIEIKLRYPIFQDGPIFLKLLLRNGGAGTFDMKGHVTLLESVPLDLFASLV